MKNIIVNKYKDSSPKSYYYIVEEFDTNKPYIGNNIEMLSSNVTARLKFDYEFKLIEPGKYDLTNVKLDNIYYNDYNLIIFNKETVNGDKVNYYYEFIRDNSNSFILLKKVKLDFDYKNIYI